MGVGEVIDPVKCFGVRLQVQHAHTDSKSGNGG